MTKVTREQFEFKSDLEVRHIPTGATFSTYSYDNYDDPQHPQLWGNLARTGEVLEDGNIYEPDDVRRVATELLHEGSAAKR